MNHDQPPSPDPAGALGDQPTPPTASMPLGRGRRPALWALLGVAALGAAGGIGAGAALAGGSDGSATVTLAAATDDTEGAATDGAATEGDDATACEDRGPGRHDGAERGARPGAHGTVAAVDGTTLTITGGDEADATETTVATTDDTTVISVDESTIAEVAVGDNVVVTGGRPGAEDEESTDAAVARSIVDLGALDPAALRPERPAGEDTPAPEGDAPEGTDGESDEAPSRARRGGGAGTVSAVSDTSITVTTDDGDVTFAIDGDTAVTAVSEITVADLAEGDVVSVRGESSEDGVVAASHIVRGDTPFGGGFGGRGGPGGPGGRGPR